MVAATGADPAASADLRVIPETVRDQAYRRLRQAITTGRFGPGQRLVERELCELLGVSRTSVREALRMLESDRLIVMEPYKGPCVTALSAEEARQIYVVRRALESLAGELAARHATADDLARIKAALGGFEAAVAGGDLPLLVDAAAAFYDALLTASGNAVIRELLGALQARVSLLRATSMSKPERTPQSAREMRAIYEAVASGDAPRAAQACADHIDQACKAALRQFA